MRGRATAAAPGIPEVPPADSSTAEPQAICG